MPELSTALRTQVRDRAKRRCEYCRSPEIVTLIDHEIDHIVAVKHGGETAPENLALCCALLTNTKAAISLPLTPTRVNSSACFIRGATGGVIILSSMALRYWLEQVSVEQLRAYCI